MTYILILFLLLALLLGAVLGWLVANNKSTKNFSEERTRLTAEKESLQVRAETLEGQLEEQKQTAESRLAEMHEQQQKRLDELQRQYRQQLDDMRRQEKEHADETQEQHGRHLAMLRDQYEQQLKTLKEQKDRELQTLHSQYDRTLGDLRKQQEELREQQQAQMTQQQKLISEQFGTASERILKERSEQLSTANNEQLAAILTPLHENIRQMREAVEKSDRDQATTMVHLEASIRENLKQAKEVGERADKLAQALTSENKTQGNFGELRLRQLLENMGLEEGVQFEEQATIKDAHGNAVHGENGRRMIPDVILHFPDHRDVVIDSKMSLTAFEEYYNATDEAERQAALKRHLQSMRQHVKELAQKNYSGYIRDGRQQLDFVLMYVFSESALQLALTNDPTLWKDAYDQGVVISGSQNLYMMLRVLEMTWKQVRQVENQQKIIDTANVIVDRVQAFYERFVNVDEHLRKTREAFDKLKTVTAPNGPSIITAAQKLIRYGAKENPKRKQRLMKAVDEEVPETTGERPAEGLPGEK